MTTTDHTIRTHLTQTDKEAPRPGSRREAVLKVFISLQLRHQLQDIPRTLLREELRSLDLDDGGITNMVAEGYFFEFTPMPVLVYPSLEGGAQ